MPLTIDMVEPSSGNQALPEPAGANNSIDEGNQSLNDDIIVKSFSDSDGEPSQPPEETGEQPPATPKEEETTPKVEGKQPYTNEEIAQLLSSEQEVDTDRLTPEGKILMKSFQSGFNKKFEKLSEKQKELERIQQESQKKSEPETPREKYYQEFLKHPDKVVGEINSAISELEVDPYNEDNRKKISALRQMKDEFLVRKTTEVERKHQEIENSGKVAEIISKTRQEIHEAIPDFEKKVPELNNFATQLGLTMDDLNFITNPLNTGAYAAKLTKVLNKAYDIINAGKTAEKKIDKTSPPALGRPGAGKTKEQEVSLEDLSQEEFEKEWSKKYN